MRKTSFGRMQKHTLPTMLSPDCEVMQFEKRGKAHRHDDKDEFAIAVAGSGVVVVGGDHWPVSNRSPRISKTRRPISYNSSWRPIQPAFYRSDGFDEGRVRPAGI